MMLRRRSGMARRTWTPLKSAQLEDQGVDFNGVHVRRAMAKRRGNVVAGACAHHQHPAGIRNQPVGKLVGGKPIAVRLRIGKRAVNSGERSSIFW